MMDNKVLFSFDFIRFYMAVCCGHTANGISRYSLLTPGL